MDNQLRDLYDDILKCYFSPDQIIYTTHPQSTACFCLGLHVGFHLGGSEKIQEEHFLIKMMDALASRVNFPKGRLGRKKEELAHP